MERVKERLSIAERVSADSIYQRLAAHAALMRAWLDAMRNRLEKQKA